MTGCAFWLHTSNALWACIGIEPVGRYPFDEPRTPFQATDNSLIRATKRSEPFVLAKGTNKHVGIIKHMSHRISQARNALAGAAASSNARRERVRQSTGVVAPNRGVRTSLIDADWDLEPDTDVAHESVAPRSEPPAPCISIIDFKRGVHPYTSVTHGSESHRIDTIPPRTSLIDTEWDALLDPGTNLQESARSPARPRQLALLDIEDADDELDPIITYFELDGPECLGLDEDELE